MVNKYVYIMNILCILYHPFFIIIRNKMYILIIIIIYCIYIILTCLRIIILIYVYIFSVCLFANYQ